MQSGTLSYSNEDIILFVSDILHITAHTEQRECTSTVSKAGLPDSRARVITDTVVMEHVIFWHSQLSSLATRQLKELNEHTTDWKWKM